MKIKKLAFLILCMAVLLVGVATTVSAGTCYEWTESSRSAPYCTTPTCNGSPVIPTEFITYTYKCTTPATSTDTRVEMVKQGCC